MGRHSTEAIAVASSSADDGMKCTSLPILRSYADIAVITFQPIHDVFDWKGAVKQMRIHLLIFVGSALFDAAAMPQAMNSALAPRYGDEI